jgi:hypothetical protein
MWKMTWKKADKKPLAAAPAPEAGNGNAKQPPAGPGWESRLLALASGVGIMAQPVFALDFFSALIAGEMTGTMLEAAQKRHDKSKDDLNKWHVAAITDKAEELMRDVLAKDPARLTDAERIRLSLFAEWGFLATEEGTRLSPAQEAQVLMTQLAVAVGQNDVNSLKLAENFAFPVLEHENPATPEGLKRLREDKLRLHEMLTGEKSDDLAGPVFGRIRKKLSRSFLDASVNLATKKRSLMRSSLSLLVDVSALRQAWGIVLAHGPAPTAEVFVQRMCKELQKPYDEGRKTMRRAARIALKQSGIAHEYKLVKKPEGGFRNIVRRRRDVPPGQK